MLFKFRISYYLIYIYIINLLQDYQPEDDYNDETFGSGAVKGILLFLLKVSLV